METKLENTLVYAAEDTEEKVDEDEKEYLEDANGDDDGDDMIEGGEEEDADEDEGFETEEETEHQ